jgi:hypothetical protein
VTSEHWGYCALVAFVMIWVCAGAAYAFTRRLRTRAYVTDALPIGHQREVLQKVRTRAPLTAAEWELAHQVLSTRGNPLAFTIPATLFFLGCFFVFGSLEQLHGHPPSERTFLGIIPMLTATNLSIQMLKGARLKRRLPARVPPAS